MPANKPHAVAYAPDSGETLQLQIKS